MVKIEVSHKRLKKIISMEIAEALYSGVKSGLRNPLVYIVIKYKEKTGYSCYINPYDIIIKLIKDVDKCDKSSSFAHRTDGLSSCEETCPYCNIGQYDRCLNRKK